MRDLVAGIRVARSLGRRSGGGIAFRLGQGAWFHSIDTKNLAGLDSTIARLRAFSPCSRGPVGRGREICGVFGRGLGRGGLLNALSCLAKAVGRIAAHSSVR